MDHEIPDPAKILAAVAQNQEIREAFGGFLSPVAKEIGNYLADKIRFARFRESIKCAKRAREMLAEAGTEQVPVELKVLVPIAEGCSLEESDELVEVWARLLASAASGRAVIPAYPKILQELSPSEVRILDLVFREHVAWEARSGNLDEATAKLDYHGVPSQKLVELMNQDGLSQNQFEVFVANLQRLRLIEESPHLDVDMRNMARAEFRPDERLIRLHPTVLAIAFMNACGEPSHSWSTGSEIEP
jgi:hypothetical protein